MLVDYLGRPLRRVKRYGLEPRQAREYEIELKQPSPAIAAVDAIGYPDPTPASDEPNEESTCLL